MTPFLFLQPRYHWTRDSTSSAPVFDSFQSIAHVSQGTSPARPSLSGTLFAIKLWDHNQLRSRLVEPSRDVDPWD